MSVLVGVSAVGLFRRELSRPGAVRTTDGTCRNLELKSNLFKSAAGLVYVVKGKEVPPQAQQQRVTARPKHSPSRGALTHKNHIKSRNTYCFCQFLQSWDSTDARVIMTGEPKAPSPRAHTHDSRS